MGDKAIDSLREALLEELLSEVTRLNAGVTDAAAVLDRVVPSARSEIEKGGEYAALKFRELVDDRISQVRKVLHDIAGLRELLLGEIALRARTQSDEEVRRVLLEILGHGTRQRWFESCASGAIGSLVALAAMGTVWATWHWLAHR